MKYYEDHLKVMEYACWAAGHYGFEDYMRGNIIFYDAFKALGFSNLCSYFSVVPHERYFKEVDELRMFVFRNGGNYWFETNTEYHGILDLSRQTVILQEGPCVFSPSSITTGLVKVIHDTYFVS